eukprot:TRINITY_DN3608_c0_g1_i1.p1 TRINITY_DN3608_c0_g1~~TRINITY_DN3608_c0_g1_i1.p1  ORF type:complete len:445 (+),score=96.53 TRINITY_DN3608_c0_g1_i1:86-1420(+)
MSKNDNKRKKNPMDAHVVWDMMSKSDKKVVPKPTQFPKFMNPIFFHNYIPRQFLKNLNTYTYHGSNLSWLANNVAHPIWLRILEYIPPYLSANIMTLFGFCGIVMGYIGMAIASAEMGKEIGWPFLLFSIIVLFLYLNIDGLDGKQARRTNTSSPLGELCDHGCDSMTSGLLVMSMSCAMRMKGSFTYFLMLFVSQTAFYFAQWQEYHTGELVLGEIAVLEAELMMIKFYVITMIWGNEWGQGEVKMFTHFFNLKVRYVDFLFFILSILAFKTVFFQNISDVKKVYEKNKEKFWRALKGTGTHVLINVGLITWLILSPNREKITGTYLLHLFSLTIVIYNSQLSCRQILAKMCDMGDLYLLQFYYFPLPILVSLLNVFLIGSESIDLFLVYFNFFSSLLFHLHLILSFTKEICEYTKINAFFIPHNGQYSSYFHFLSSKNKSDN